MHATSSLIVEMLEGMDRDRFELVLYSSGPDDGSAIRQRVRATAGLWREVLDWNDAHLAQCIRDDEIGVLIDMKGYTQGSRQTVLARRPAPLQVAWLGYPGTAGADYVDYIVGDPVVTPLSAQDGYCERIAQMPHCYQPNDSTRLQPATLPRSACGLPEDAFVFASFNQSYKIVPEVFQAWCQILSATPGSVLWLMVPQADVQARLRAAAASLGVDGERLVFAPFVGIDVHRARLPNADLFLDSFPCSGHTTASDALWAGVPILTLTGRSFASRVAASLLHTITLDELVCDDIDHYCREATRYAHDAAALQALRQRVQAARHSSPLFDGRRFAADFGDLLMRMVERQDAGLPPAPLAATPHLTTPGRAA
jgi:predicted O-linked N-acetylglucosamine transferase (SPINDLY family)